MVYCMMVYDSIWHMVYCIMVYDSIWHTVYCMMVYGILYDGIWYVMVYEYMVYGVFGGDGSLLPLGLVGVGSLKMFFACFLTALHHYSIHPSITFRQCRPPSYHSFALDESLPSFYLLLLNIEYLACEMILSKRSLVDGIDLTTWHHVVMVVLEMNHFTRSSNEVIYIYIYIHSSLATYIITFHLCFPIPIRFRGSDSNRIHLDIPRLVCSKYVMIMSHI
mgnify:CR=1 FL=1